MNRANNKHITNVTDKLSLQSLGAYAKLRGATFSSFMSVCRSPWNNMGLTGRIFMKFDIWKFLEKSVYKIAFY